jgi:hypothetical protein
MSHANSPGMLIGIKLERNGEMPYRRQVLTERKAIGGLRCY